MRGVLWKRSACWVRTIQSKLQGSSPTLFSFFHCAFRARIVCFSSKLLCSVFPSRCSSLSSVRLIHIPVSQEMRREVCYISVISTKTTLCPTFPLMKLPWHSYILTIQHLYTCIMRCIDSWGRRPLRENEQSRAKKSESDQESHHKFWCIIPSARIHAGTSPTTTTMESKIHLWNIETILLVFARWSLFYIVGCPPISCSYVHTVDRCLWTPLLPQPSSSAHFYVDAHCLSRSYLLFIYF